MAKNRKKARGFSPEVRDPIENSGYETIFEKIVRRTNGEKKSLSWYKNELRSITDGMKLISGEKRDGQQTKETRDQNVLTIIPKRGRLYFFEYEAKSRWLPYYDTFPLLYMLGKGETPDTFYGANLHYLEPKKRIQIINNLKGDIVDIPRNIIHKYIKKQVKSLYLELAEPEWETSILLPVENFVKTSGSGKLPYKSEDVWQEIGKKYYERVKAHRIVSNDGSN